eukprot:TRINITY_DN52924_c0_g1_i1.p2 TRINITY_DN52924_c0_g1~~TRINITY_DN52924_c0_g1_i1.p2  ORF type:complete len:101 (+),score=44.98 TRINITY_DN52924_c0_g1_i1:108-410(+)
MCIRDRSEAGLPVKKLGSTKRMSKKERELRKKGMSGLEIEEYLAQAALRNRANKTDTDKPSSKLKVEPKPTEPVLSLIHISEPTRLLSISYAVFCLKKKT